MTIRTIATRIAFPVAVAAAAAAASAVTALPALPAQASTKGTAVTVTEKGAQVSTSKTSVPAGWVTFAVVNKGTGSASVALVSHGHKTQVSKRIAGGKKGTWTVHVAKGSYTLSSSADAKGGAVFTVTGHSSTSSTTSSSSGSGGYGY